MIDTALFLLTGRFRAALFVAAATAASWWFLSDYYWAREFSWWTEVMDVVAFMPAAVLLALGVVAFYRRRIASALRAIATVPSLAPPDYALEVSSWRVVLTHLCVRLRGTSAAGYCRWLSRRLGAANQTASVSATHLARYWWRSWRSFVRVGLPLIWLPLWCAALAGLPRYTTLMERVSTAATGYDAQIFDVVVSGLLPGPPGPIAPRRVTESIYSPRRMALVRSRTAFVSNGFITVRVSDFPRVARRLKAICWGRSPSCSVAAESDADHGFEIEVPVRAGVARVHFEQKTHELEPTLGLRLWLLRADGALMDEVTLER